jgi:hypothetical protein
MQKIMLNPRRLALAGLLVGLLALLPSGASFAKEIVQVTLSGPGLAEPLVMTDADHRAQFSNLGYGAPLAEAPAGLDNDYFEIEVAFGDGTEIFAANVYHYIPGINADHGYLYYADVINGSSSAEGKWFQLDDSTDRDLRRILREAGVRFGVTTQTKESAA